VSTSAVPAIEARPSADPALNDSSTPSRSTQDAPPRVATSVWASLALLFAATGLLAYAFWGPTSEYAPPISSSHLDTTIRSDGNAQNADFLGMGLPANRQTLHLAGITLYPDSQLLDARTDRSDDSMLQISVWEIAGGDLLDVQKHYAEEAMRLGFVKVKQEKHDLGPLPPRQQIYLKNKTTLMIQARDSDASVRVTLWLSYTGDPPKSTTGN